MSWGQLMTIQQLVDQIDSPNIAADLDEDMLQKIGARVYRQFEEDYESMTDWLEGVENGLELMKQEFETKSTPWEGASNYKDPLLHQASIQFGDRATLELLRSKELVSCEVVGKDPQGQKAAASERVVDYMNYQVNHDMNDWRGSQETLFYSLPNTGDCFKKLVRDEVEETVEAELVMYPDFVVNQATKNMHSCRSWSQILDRSKNEVEWRVNQGIWLPVEAYEAIDAETQGGDAGSNEAEKVLDCLDNDYAFVEQSTYYDIDGDGYEEPYIITIHGKSKQVVRIVARYDLKSVYVRLNDRTMPLPEAMEMQTAVNVEETGGEEFIDLVGLDQAAVEPSYQDFKLIKIVAFNNVVHYPFIPSPDGTFLGLGYSHLLGAMTSSINTTTNQLHDAGTLRNLGGGMLSKEFRNEKGEMRLKIGQWKQTQVPADKLANGIYPNPSPEPSDTLYNLNDQIRGIANQFVAVTDLSGNITAQTAPTTALAMIQEAMIPTSALFKRVLKAESEEFKILFRINSRTLQQDKYQEVLDDPEANVQVDFNMRGLDIFPTANAEMSSKMQRLQIAELEMSQYDRVLQSGGNPLPIIESFFESIGSPLTEQIFSNAGELTPEEEQRLQQLRDAQNTANQLQQLQLEILQAEQNRLNFETVAKVDKIYKEIDKLNADIVETVANTIKIGEEAESESLNNQITSYTANLQVQLDQLQGIFNAPREISQSALLQIGSPN